MPQSKLNWQSDIILILVLLYVGAGAVTQFLWWAANSSPTATFGPTATYPGYLQTAGPLTVCLSLLLSLATMALRAATPAAALTGAGLTACLILATSDFLDPWHTVFLPILAVFVLALFASRLASWKKRRQGTVEERQKWNASQVAANLGIAAIAYYPLGTLWLINSGWFQSSRADIWGPLDGMNAGGLFSAIGYKTIYAPALAALAMAASCTVSSEVGRALGGRPRMVTTLRQVERGTTGAISLAGTLAGVTATGIVVSAGTWALHARYFLFWIGYAGGVFGLFFNSLLGATLESRGWLNKDAVKFLSAAGAVAFTLGLMAILSHAGVACDEPWHC